ncbi:hypothetical protein SETIT_7G150900v2 [Setaria italica]|uniref:DUF642 domain-containing protein n=1 Tax=Setaria italica TaxID=4555 RepID=A0A368RW60_SETIT|nr:hypothetical protein SETIT_7G150900v2 [Setaria italica]
MPCAWVTVCTTRRSTINSNNGALRDPALGDLGVRGVHRLRPEAGRHAPAGAGGRLRRAARQRGLHATADPRGAAYSITFSAARTCFQAEQLDVTVAPESDILPIQTVYTSSGWDSYSWAFKATCSVVLFIVHNPGVSEDPACGPLIDLFAIKTLPPPKSSKNNMRKNGDFEEGPYIFRNTPWGVLVPPMDEDDYSPLSPWMVMSSTKSVKFVDAPHHVVPHGARAVELVSGVETALVQDVGTVAGLPYRLEFSAGDAGDGCAGAMTVQAYAGRGSVRVPDQSQGKGGHKRGVLEFTAIANQTRVVFISMAYNMKGDGTLCGPVVDDVSFVCTRKHGARRVLL